MDQGGRGGAGTIGHPPLLLGTRPQVYPYDFCTALRPPTPIIHAFVCVHTFSLAFRLTINDFLLAIDPPTVFCYLDSVPARLTAAHAPRTLVRVSTSRVHEPG